MQIDQSIQTNPTIVGAASSKSATISSDFQTFLKMLTVQMQNQDPLNPVDSSDYAVQLATFSGVEQQVKTNDLLTALAAQMGSTGMAQMASWVGKEARAAMPAYFNGSPVTVAPNPAAIANRVEMVVRNADGAEVQRLNLPVSADPVKWAGVDADGNPFPSGLYSFEVVSLSDNTVLMSEQAEVYGTVQEVRAEGGQTVLMMAGGVGVLATSVTALRDPAFF
jgi:flagellar basal-body rod modification protein FlgD